MKTLLLLIAYTAYLVWVAFNMSDVNLNIASCVTFLTLACVVYLNWPSKPRPKNTCPECGGVLHPIRSQFIKMCGSCGYEEPWELKPGQKPLVTNNRQKG